MTPYSTLPQSKEVPSSETSQKYDPRSPSPPYLPLNAQEIAENIITLSSNEEKQGNQIPHLKLWPSY